MDHQKSQLYFFWLLLAGITIVCFLIFLPYLGILILALSLAVAVEPWHHWLLKFCKGRKGLAALLTIIIVALIVLTPLTFIGQRVFNESKGLYAYISVNQNVVIETVTHRLQTWLPRLTFNPQTYLEQFSTAITSSLASVFSTTISTLLFIVLGLISFFFFLRDGDYFLKYLVKISPLDDQYDELIIHKLKGAINTVIRGSLLLGVIQGIVAGLGFVIFGLPSPALWGVIVAIASFVPTIGTSLITLPAAAYLFLSGHALAALGLLLWSIIAVGLIDNLLSPFLMSRGMKIHPLFFLFAILGGISLFGPIGILLGPLAVSLFFSLVDIYRLLILKQAPKS